MRGQDEAARVVAQLSAELARIAGFDVHAILGVTRNAEKRELHAAYLKLAKKYHPNRFLRFGAESAHLATELFIRIGKAYKRCLRERPIKPASPPRAPGSRLR